MRNSLIYGTNTSSSGPGAPIYSAGHRCKISIDDIQFHSASGTSGTAGLRPSVYSNATTLPIYIGAMCISEFDVNYQCSNPLTGGDLRTDLYFTSLHPPYNVETYFLVLV